MDEHALGEDTPRDVVMERGLHHDDPRTCDWGRAVFSVTNERDPSSSFRWAVGRLDDERPAARAFAADVLLGLVFTDPPFQADLAGIIRPRLATETDSRALRSLITAYAEQLPDPRPEVTAHAAHPDPRVRAAVAGAIHTAADPLLLTLADDPDRRVRAAALTSLFNAGPSTPPPVLAAYATHRDDDHLPARVEALAGLARHGDDEVDRWRQVLSRL